jgi:hypothetical protein
MKIKSQLNAKLVTDNRVTESGDSMDVKHLSLAIPGLARRECVPSLSLPKVGLPVSNSGQETTCREKS